MFQSRGLEVPASLYRCTVWLQKGHAAGAVLAAVEAVLKRGKAISSLEYFDGAIADAHAKAQTAPSLEPVPLTDDDWRASVARYKSSRSLWSRHAGPEPGMAGCRCPAQVLVEALIDPNTGLDMDARWVFVSEGTVEMSAYLHDAQCRKARPPRSYEIEISGVAKRGFYSSRSMPAGYDEATGEKLPPKTEDAA